MSGSAELARLRADMDEVNQRLASVLHEYAFDYFNTARAHQGIEQRVPAPTDRTVARSIADVTARPVLGGLHRQNRAETEVRRAFIGATHHDRAVRRDEEPVRVILSRAPRRGCGQLREWQAGRRGVVDGVSRECRSQGRW